MTCEVSIRPGRVDDARLIVQAYWRAQTTQSRIDIVARYLTNEPSFVAEDTAGLVGFVYCKQFAPDILEIDNLFVHEDYRRQNIGGILLARLEKSAALKYSGLILVNSDLYANPVVDKQDPTNFYIRNGYGMAFATEHSRVFAKQL